MGVGIVSICLTKCCAGLYVSDVSVAQFSADDGRGLSIRSACKVSRDKDEREVASPAIHKCCHYQWQPLLRRRTHCAGSLGAPPRITTGFLSCTFPPSSGAKREEASGETSRGVNCAAAGKTAPRALVPHRCFNC